MTRIKQVAVLAGITMLFTACSKSAPKCSDVETTNTVIQIVKNQAGITDQEGMTIKLEAVRTTDVNKTTGSQSCAASFVTILEGYQNGRSEIPVEYKSELSDKGEHIVSVKKRY